MRAVLASLALVAALSLSVPAAAQTALTGDLSALREQALTLVNDARRGRGLQPLTLSDPLNAAAQAHAEDMLARGYYDHLSPEGGDVRDRYIDAGGSEWQIVQENIATCSPCAGAPGQARVASLHEGWMDSPEHRENILRPGISGFGFGIAAGENGPLYAVQTFAGAGTPGGLESESTRLESGEAAAAFAQAVNERRRARDLPPLGLDPALSSLAAALVPDDPEGEIDMRPEGGLMSALPEGERDRWRGLSVLAGSCGGCGARATEGDIGYFLDLWMDDPGYSGRLLGREAAALGFALRAYGNGRKVAVAVLGRPG